MRKGVTWSAVLHVLVVVLAVFGLPHLWEDRQIAETPMIVEVVNLAEVTTAKDTPKPVTEKKEPPKAPPPPPEPPKARAPSEPPPPEPPKIAEVPAPQAEKVPEKKAPEPKKVPEKKPQPEAKTPQPEPPKARPQRKPPQPKEDFLHSVLRDVTPEKRAPEPRKEPEKKPPEPQAQAKVEQRQAPLDAQVTTSEIDAIRAAIAKCWIVPAGAPSAENLIVTIRVWINPDGTVREARLDRDHARLGSDDFFRAAAESALRAVRNERCQPLPIPPKKYEQFKDLVLNFDPKKAAGS